MIRKNGITGRQPIVRKNLMIGGLSNKMSSMAMFRQAIEYGIINAPSSELYVCNVM